jgi:radical S-adenosyl methionine domain-containing protein 2
MYTALILSLTALLATLTYLHSPLSELLTTLHPTTPRGPIPISVNYHFTRFCNYSCGFCFHVSKNTYIAPLTSAKRALTLLKAAGTKKINFAGGEPFLYPAFLGEMLRFSKEELGMESVSIVTNGSKVTEKFLREHRGHLDILAVSCDSFDEGVNKEIGRTEKGKPAGQVRQLFRIAEWCQEFGIKFKLNTVVNALNWREDMAPVVEQLDPFRWKVFQVLLVESENDSMAKDRKGNFDKFYLSDEDFEAFCER